MLVNFSVKNFKSFRDHTEFSMDASKLKNLKEDNTFEIHTHTLLKSAVIYGANASGKSSFIDALRLMTGTVQNSVDIEKRRGYIAQPFLLNTDTQDRETCFEIECIIEDILYRYGFEIATDATIIKEWLYQKKLQAKARESRLFERKKSEFLLGTTFKEGKLLIDKTRPTALFLSVVTQFNGEISTKLTQWFDSLAILSNLRSEEFQHYSFDKLEDDLFKEKILGFIKSADIGIHDILKKKISFEELDNAQDVLGDLPNFILEDIKKNGLSSIETVHMQYNKENAFDGLKSFALDFESDGTQKLLALTAPIIETLSKGTILVIDELDNSLHTELVKAIVQLFNSKEHNPNGAQLIFSTHDTNLLDQALFRRDQIWFTDKDIYGSSELYSLIEYGKGKTRDDLALEKNYLQGKFGAFPHIYLRDEES